MSVISQEDANNILSLLNRAELKGSEVPIYIRCISIIKALATDAPTQSEETSTELPEEGKNE
jgi:hypothetical protein